MSRFIKQEDIEMKDRDEDASSFTKKETIKVENEEDHESPQPQLPQSAVLPGSTPNSSLQDNHESGSIPTSHPQTNQTTNLTSTVQTSSTKKETAKIENEEEHKSPQPQLPPSGVLPEPTRNTSIQDNQESGSIPTSQPSQNQTTNLTFLIHTPSTWAADFGDHPKTRRRARPAQQTTIQSSSSGKLPVSSVEKSHEDPTAGSQSVWATNRRDRSSTPLNVGDSSTSRHTGISTGDPSSSKRVFQKEAIRTIQPRPSVSSRNVHNFPPAVEGSSSVSGSIVQATQPHGDYRPALASSSRSTRPDPVPLPDLTPLTGFIFHEDVIRQFLDLFAQTDFERILYTPHQLHDLRSQLVWGADGRINQIEKNKIHDPFTVNNQIVTSKFDLPIEVCNMVGSLLPRDDVLNLRLVNKPTEMLFSGLAFRSVVVPFRPEIYRMLAMDQSALILPAGITKSNLNDKGKGKARSGPSDEDLSIQTRLAKLRGNDYDGMKIFKAWGSHIRKFAMTFDLDQGESAIHFFNPFQ